MPLQEELDRRRREICARLDPADRKVLEDGIERLRMLQVAETGLAVGDTLPDFALLDPEGRVWRSDELLARGPLVLSFFRGAWCPYCDLAMRALEAVRPEIEALGATLLGVAPTRPEDLARVATDRALHYPLLTDVGEEFAKLCGVRFELAAEHVDFYRRYGVDMPAAQAGAGWELPVPATWVVRQDGVVVWAFADADWGRRAEPEAVLEALRRLVQPAAPPARSRASG
jgi:peroxiredoxin